MFPEARRILHVFSGGLTQGGAIKAAGWDVNDDRRNFDMAAKGLGMELVDLHGPDQGRFPTWQGDLFEFCNLYERHEEQKYDLILADPPYSAADAEKYDVPMVNRGKVMRALRKVAKTGANLVWLDTCWPQHRKTEWKTWGTIGLVRSTMHRVRLVSMFRAVES